MTVEQFEDDDQAQMYEMTKLREKIAKLKALCEAAIIKLRISEYPSDWQFADQMEEEINK